MSGPSGIRSDDYYYCIVTIPSMNEVNKLMLFGFYWKLLAYRMCGRISFLFGRKLKNSGCYSSSILRVVFPFDGADYLRRSIVVDVLLLVLLFRKRSPFYRLVKMISLFRVSCFSKFESYSLFLLSILREVNKRGGTSWRWLRLR